MFIQMEWDTHIGYYWYCVEAIPVKSYLVFGLQRSMVAQRAFIR